MGILILREEARRAFSDTQNHFDAPDNYLFEDFEHDLITNICLVIEDGVRLPFDNDAIEAYALTIKSALLAMKHRTHDDNSDVVIDIMNEYIRKRSH